MTQSTNTQTSERYDHTAMKIIAIVSSHLNLETTTPRQATGSQAAL